MLVIKYPEMARKARRTRNKDVDAFIAEPKHGIKEVVVEKKTEDQPVQLEKSEETKKDDKKVELKDIEQKLEELLGE